MKPGDTWTDPVTGKTVALGRPGKPGHPLEPAGKDEPDAPLHAAERPLPVREDPGGTPPLQQRKHHDLKQVRAEVAPGGRRSLGSKGARTQPGTRPSTWQVRVDGGRWVVRLLGEIAPLGEFGSRAEAVKAARRMAAADLPSRLEVLDRDGEIEATIDFGEDVD